MAALSMGERQRVEILKALWRDARVLILDEPTAVLTPNEADDSDVSPPQWPPKAGASSLLVTSSTRSRRFVMKATVLRGGKTVASSLSVDDLDAGRMAELMVGAATAVSQRRVRRNTIGEQVLEVESLTVHDIHSRAVVDDVSFTVGRGEVVGIAGVAGNGQRPLADAIAGLLSASSGSVSLTHTDISSLPPRDRNSLGLAYVPEDRIGVGLAPRMDAVDNAIMRNYHTLGSGPFIDRSEATARATGLIDKYNIKVGRIDAPLAGLSGGNLQRLLVGRELDDEPVVLIAAQPTRGLDVQGVAAIQEILSEQAAHGVGIVLISEDLEELFALSDRLLVMHEGHVVAEFDPDSATRQAVGAAMAGAVEAPETEDA